MDRLQYLFLGGYRLLDWIRYDGRFSGFISEWIVTPQDEMVKVPQFTVAGVKA